jgi:hypothetical protein
LINSSFQDEANQINKSTTDQLASTLVSLWNEQTALIDQSIEQLGQQTS